MVPLALLSTRDPLPRCIANSTMKFAPRCSEDGSRRVRGCPPPGRLAQTLPSPATPWPALSTSCWRRATLWDVQAPALSWLGSCSRGTPASVPGEPVGGSVAPLRAFRGAAACRLHACHSRGARRRAPRHPRVRSFRSICGPASPRVCIASRKAISSPTVIPRAMRRSAAPSRISARRSRRELPLGAGDRDPQLERRSTSRPASCSTPATPPGWRYGYFGARGAFWPPGVHCAPVPVDPKGSG